MNSLNFISKGDLLNTIDYNSVDLSEVEWEDQAGMVSGAGREGGWLDSGARG